MLRSLQDRRWFLILSCIFFTVLFIRHAWVAEDAYISFRVIDNFVNGYGLRWNIAERVQAFTHPLWVLLLIPCYALFQDPYFWAVTLSYVFSGAAFCLMMRAASDDVWRGVFVSLTLFASKAFMDYTSSGLENALSFLLVFLLFRHALSRSDDAPKHLLITILLSAFLALNRQDLILLALPPIVHETYQVARSVSWKALARDWLLGFAPLYLWFVFALVYYGFVFPNTYYAKLQTGIPKAEMWKQGLVYYYDSLGRDPVTLPVIGLILLLAWTQKPFRLAASGICLYLIYVLNIGGDFMSGRFFSVPLVASLSLFIAMPVQPWLRPTLKYAVLILALFAVSSPVSPFASDRSFSNASIPLSGVADERGWYFQQMGLLQFNMNSRFPDHYWRQLGENWRKAGGITHFSNIGIAGYYAGPHVHIVDGHALTDAFLARLPARVNPDGTWRIGHFMRELPAMYLESLRANQNLITDQTLRAKYDDMTLITRAPLFSLERWHAILRQNTGG